MTGTRRRGDGRQHRPQVGERVADLEADEGAAAARRQQPIAGGVRYEYPELVQFLVTGGDDGAHFERRELRHQQRGTDSGAAPGAAVEGGHQQQPIRYLRAKLPRHLARQRHPPALQVEFPRLDREVAAQPGVAAVQVGVQRAHRHHLPARAGRGQRHAPALARGDRPAAKAPLQPRREVVQQPPARRAGGRSGGQPHLQMIAAYLQVAARDAGNEAVRHLQHHDQRHQTQTDAERGAAEVGAGAGRPAAAHQTAPRQARRQPPARPRRSAERPAHGAGCSTPPASR